MNRKKSTIRSMPLFLILVFVGSLLAGSATVAGGYLLHQMFPLSLFEGTLVFVAMLLIGIIGTGLMSIVDCMSQQFGVTDEE